MYLSERTPWNPYICICYMNVLEDSCLEFSSPQADLTCRSIRTLHLLVMLQMIKCHLKNLMVNQCYYVRCNKVQYFINSHHKADWHVSAFQRYMAELQRLRSKCKQSKTINLCKYCGLHQGKIYSSPITRCGLI